MKVRKSLIKVLIVVLTFSLIISLSVVTAFSWYNRTKRPDQTSYLLDYKQTGIVNNVGGSTISTYVGTNANGVVTYAEDAATSTVSVAAGKVAYFKTTITADATGDVLASLYIGNVLDNTKVHIGIISPEKTYKPFIETTDTKKIVCIEDNISVNSNGSIDVYWFIDNDGTTAFSINPGDVYLVYN